MAQVTKIFALALALLNVVGAQNPPAPIACCFAAAASTSAPCQAATTTTTTTTTTPSPFECPYVPPSTTTTTTTTTSPTTTTTTSTTDKPSSDAPIGRNPDPGPSETPTTKPNFVVLPNLIGYPPLPMFPRYPMGGYIPIVEDPKTGQRYYVVPNPNPRTNKYSQVLNIYAPDFNPYYSMPPVDQNNGTLTEKPTEKPTELKS